MPDENKPKPTQDKPLWEYAVGGLFWGFGFFGAALILKKAFMSHDGESLGDEVDDFVYDEDDDYEDDD
jgi:hypothetical protein